MKNPFYFMPTILIWFVLALALASCEQEGPQGPEGPQGEQGPPGTANVMYSE